MSNNQCPESCPHCQVFQGRVPVEVLTAADVLAREQRNPVVEYDKEQAAKKKAGKKEPKPLEQLSAPVTHVLRFFAWSHLPPHLQEVSRKFADLAEAVARGPQNPETTVALLKLLEAKDCAVRAYVVKE